MPRRLRDRTSPRTSRWTDRLRRSISRRSPFSRAARSSKINVNIGDMVRKGELLATIDPRTLEAQLAQARRRRRRHSASAQGSVVGYPVQVADQRSDGSNREGFARERQARLRSEQTALQAGLRFGDARCSSRKRTTCRRSRPTTTPSSGCATTSSALQNVKAQQAQAAAAAAQAQLLSTQLSQTYLYAPYDAVVANRLVDPGRVRIALAARAPGCARRQGLDQRQRSG